MHNIKIKNLQLILLISSIFLFACNSDNLSYKKSMNSLQLIDELIEVFGHKQVKNKAKDKDKKYFDDPDDEKYTNNHPVELEINKVYLPKKLDSSKLCKSCKNCKKLDATKYIQGLIKENSKKQDCTNIYEDLNNKNWNYWQAERIRKNDHSDIFNLLRIFSNKKLTTYALLCLIIKLDLYLQKYKVCGDCIESILTHIAKKIGLNQKRILTSYYEIKKVVFYFYEHDFGKKELATSNCTQFKSAVFEHIDFHDSNQKRICSLQSFYELLLEDIKEIIEKLELKIKNKNTLIEKIKFNLNAIGGSNKVKKSNIKIEKTKKNNEVDSFIHGRETIRFETLKKFFNKKLKKLLKVQKENTGYAKPIINYLEKKYGFADTKFSLDNKKGNKINLKNSFYSEIYKVKNAFIENKNLDIKFNDETIDLNNKKDLDKFVFYIYATLQKKACCTKCLYEALLLWGEDALKRFIDLNLEAQPNLICNFPLFHDTYDLYKEINIEEEKGTIKEHEKKKKKTGNKKSQKNQKNRNKESNNKSKTKDKDQNLKNKNNDKNKNFFNINEICTEAKINKKPIPTIDESGIKYINEEEFFKSFPYSKSFDINLFKFFTDDNKKMYLELNNYTKLPIYIYLQSENKYHINSNTINLIQHYGKMNKILKLALLINENTIFSYKNGDEKSNLEVCKSLESNILMNDESIEGIPSAGIYLPVLTYAFKNITEISTKIIKHPELRSFGILKDIFEIDGLNFNGKHPYAFEVKNLNKIETLISNFGNDKNDAEGELRQLIKQAARMMLVSCLKNAKSNKFLDLFYINKKNISNDDYIALRVLFDKIKENFIKSFFREEENNEEIPNYKNSLNIKIYSFHNNTLKEYKNKNEDKLKFKLNPDIIKFINSIFSTRLEL